PSLTETNLDLTHLPGSFASGSSGGGSCGLCGLCGRLAFLSILSRWTTYQVPSPSFFGSRRTLSSLPSKDTLCSCSGLPAQTRTSAVAALTGSSSWVHMAMAVVPAKRVNATCRPILLAQFITESFGPFVHVVRYDCVNRQHTPTPPGH